MRIGVISDTHGYLDPAVRDLFAGVDRIVHAGDIGSAQVIEDLARLAPVTAVRGNVDEGRSATGGFPPTQDIELAGHRIHLVHRLKDGNPTPGTGIIVYGHTHVPCVEESRGLLLLNPGAAGRRGFHRERTVAVLDLTGSGPRVQFASLGPRVGGDR